MGAALRVSSLPLRAAHYIAMDEWRFLMVVAAADGLVIGRRWHSTWRAGRRDGTASDWTVQAARRWGQPGRPGSPRVARVPSTRAPVHHDARTSSAGPPLHGAASLTGTAATPQAAAWRQPRVASRPAAACKACSCTRWLQRPAAAAHAPQGCLAATRIERGRGGCGDEKSALSIQAWHFAATFNEQIGA